MDFPKALRTAQKWSHENQFQLIDSDEIEARLIFSCDTVSFYVLCHDMAVGRWNVWSEDGRVLKHMTAIQDFVHSCQKRTLIEVLDFIQKELLPLAQGEEPPDEALAAPVRPVQAVPDDVDEGLEDDGEDLSNQDDEDEGSEEDGGYDATYYDGDDIDSEPEAAGGEAAANVNEDPWCKYAYNMDLLVFSKHSEQTPLNSPMRGNYVDGPSQDNFFTGNANKVAVHRILKDLKSLQSSEGKFGVQGQPRGDNLMTWDVQLTDVPKESRLGQDLDKFSKKYNREPVISLEMEFPPDYPMAPPFVRVLRPHFQFLTGHVTIGGSVCMEMLTKSGWRPTNDIESILVQIRAEIMSDPKTCLDFTKGDREYDRQAAIMAFQRMVQRYGWT